MSELNGLLWISLIRFRWENQAKEKSYWGGRSLSKAIALFPTVVGNDRCVFVWFRREITHSHKHAPAFSSLLSWVSWNSLCILCHPVINLDHQKGPEKTIAHVESNMLADDPNLDPWRWSARNFPDRLLGQIEHNLDLDLYWSSVCSI